MSSFERGNKGPAFKKDSSVYSLFFGTRTKLLEDELNELQWNQIEKLAEFNKNQRSDGLLQPTSVVKTTTNNIFYLKSQSILSVLIDGYLLKAGSNTVTGQPLAASDDKLFVKLDTAPTSGTRTDLVMLEAWFESISFQDEIRKFGGDTTPILPNNLFDQRANTETARRIQFKWRLRVISNATTPLTVKAQKPDGTNSTVNFTAISENTYCADIGIQRDQNMDLKSDGIVYAVPLATVARKANIQQIVESDVTIVVKTSSGNVVDLNVSGNATIGGDLTINGTTTYLNTNQLNIKDNIITLNSGVVGSPTLNSGIEVNRGTSPTVSIVWNEATDRWQITNDGINFYNVVIPTDTVNSASKLTSQYLDAIAEDDALKIVSKYYDSFFEIGFNQAGQPNIRSADPISFNDFEIFHRGNFNPDSKLDATANAVSSSKLSTARTISLTGGVTGSVSFDGSKNVSITTTIPSLDWSKVTNRPTTLADYGITDAASGSHNHDTTYLKLSGGTLTGTLKTHRLVLPVGPNMYA